MSQPCFTIHQTIDAKSATSRPTPTGPIALNVERTKNSQAPISTMPAMALAGGIVGKFSASQWKYEWPDGLKVRKTSASEKSTRQTTLMMLNLSM